MDKELKKLEKLAQSSEVVTEVITLIITLFHFLVKQCMMVVGAIASFRHWR